MPPADEVGPPAVVGTVSGVRQRGDSKEQLSRRGNPMRPTLVFTLFASVGLTVGLLDNRSTAEPADTRSALEKNPEGWDDLLPGKGLKGWRRVPIPPDQKLAPKNPWRGDAEK